MISSLDADFSTLNTFLKHRAFSKIFILVDENTHEHCLPLLLPNLQTEIPFEILEIEAGEEMKTMETAAQLWEILAEFEADRKSLLLNLGGGMITDLGGFVASTYKRGIPFINIPTSLLGMCDASIGGKTGIDLKFLKNIVGTFAEPEAVFLFPEFLETLPEREFKSGFAEMLKHGLIADEKHWNDLTSLEKVTARNVSPYIEQSMKIKLDIVQKDFKERNIRKTLNFGHTIGHALESLLLQTELPITHGEAVAAGMICETKLSQLEGLINAEVADLIISKLKTVYGIVDLSSFSHEKILQIMVNDKKNSNGNINFSLITGAGNCNFDVQCLENNVISALEFYRIST